MSGVFWRVTEGPYSPAAATYDPWMVFSPKSSGGVEIGIVINSVSVLLNPSGTLTDKGQFFLTIFSTAGTASAGTFTKMRPAAETIQCGVKAGAFSADPTIVDVIAVMYYDENNTNLQFNFSKDYDSVQQVGSATMNLPYLKIEHDQFFGLAATPSAGTTEAFTLIVEGEE